MDVCRHLALIVQEHNAAFPPGFVRTYLGAVVDFFKLDIGTGNTILLISNMKKIFRVQSFELNSVVFTSSKILLMFEQKPRDSF